MMKAPLMLFLILILGSISHAQSYEFSPKNGQIEFEVGQFTFSSLRGNFKKFKGSAQLDAKNQKITGFNVLINAKSIDTQNPERDAHLKNPDFFETQKYPHISFEAKNFKFEQGDLKAIQGGLQIKNINKRVTFDVYDWKNENGKLTFKAKTKIFRREFDLRYGVFAIIGNEVEIFVNFKGAPKS